MHTEMSQGIESQQNSILCAEMYTSMCKRYRAHAGAKE